MELSNFIHEKKFSLKVVPKSRKNELKLQENQLKLHLKAIPEDGKANSEVIKFFKKKYSLNVSIIAGKTSRKKVLLID
jgi:uncharacterized protein